MSLPPELADAIEALIRAQTGSAFRIETATAQPGSSVAAQWRIEGAGSRFFVKTAEASRAPLFTAECNGLAALAANGAFRVPQALGCGEDQTHAFLVLEHLDLVKLTTEHAQQAGEALAELHRDEGEHYGWPSDNFLGSCAQSNSETEHWPLFFAEHRLKPQLEWARASGFRGELQQMGERICEKIGAFFLEYRPRAALLHGELWSGNIAMLADGTPVAFDPAVYRGDRETDLAMSELFGGLPEGFYAAYRRAAPLNAGYETRKTLYNLYPILKQLNLRGSGYLRQAEWMARTLVDHLRH
ncbi:fructosamine kinase family protein [Niveibacterium terrae]|uniref:fructosamine kinase family protein n=1 Tax=Niveibacterium terrae TaxID=3373598 RepID=UPI003A8D825A